ncbi:hypothetical protein CDD83_6483 [Cordyceps sp. RAO-2017]|nr:hypothetical protein CDD83_6483 [Cordyceps sp. RAO-2017]
MSDGRAKAAATASDAAGHPAVDGANGDVADAKRDDDAAEGETADKDDDDDGDSAAAAAAGGGEGGLTTQAKPAKSPKKRRKVNHACVYCRRSHMTCDLERPCTRCIKRNIGHLCHDEPREADAKKLKNAKGVAVTAVDEPDPSDAGRNPMPSAMGPPPAFDGPRQQPSSGAGYGAAGVLGQANPLSLVQQPPAATGLQADGLNNNSASGNANQMAGFSDAWLTAQSFSDVSSYNPNYMIASHPEQRGL